MNKPPGYYKDERGREYYWDGQHRSYIPETLGELNRRAGDSFNSLVVGIFPVLMVVMCLLLWFFSAVIVGPAAGFLVVLVFVGIAVLILR